jgi:hypothetical protein
MLTQHYRHLLRRRPRLYLAIACKLFTPKRMNPSAKSKPAFSRNFHINPRLTVLAQSPAYQLYQHNHAQSTETSRQKANRRPQPFGPYTRREDFFTSHQKNDKNHQRQQKGKNDFGNYRRPFRPAQPLINLLAVGLSAALPTKFFLDHNFRYWIK